MSLQDAWGGRDLGWLSGRDVVLDTEVMGEKGEVQAAKGRFVLAHYSELTAWLVATSMAERKYRSPTCVALSNQCF